MGSSAWAPMVQHLRSHSKEKKETCFVLGQASHWPLPTATAFLLCLAISLWKLSQIGFWKLFLRILLPKYNFLHSSAPFSKSIWAPFLLSIYSSNAFFLGLVIAVIILIISQFKEKITSHIGDLFTSLHCFTILRCWNIMYIVHKW